MLALKTVLAEADATILVFDEVDANMGGEVGRAVGGAAAFVSQASGILCNAFTPSGGAGDAHVWCVKRCSKGTRW